MKKDVLAYLLDIDKSEFEKYKLHLAVAKNGSEPLDDYLADVAAGEEKGGNWERWQTRHEGGNRRWKVGEKIVSFMRVYPERDAWLFGGIFEVLKAPEGGERNKKGNFYKVELTDQGEEFIGRLKINYHNTKRPMYIYLKTRYEGLKFSEILKENYGVEPFCGYQNICLNFLKLESIYRINRDDWKTALQSIKGVYVIFDKKTGKKYVGSAYGARGVWGRWGCYVDSLDGGNKGLKKLFREIGKEITDEMKEIFKKENPREYVRKNFVFTLVERCLFEMSKEEIIKRENFWKDALLSRDGEFGYNRN